VEQTSRLRRWDLSSVVENRGEYAAAIAITSHRAIARVYGPSQAAHAEELP